MAECYRKCMDGRMEDPARERARQGWHQSLAKSANAYRLLSRDRTYDAVEERLAEIEARRDRDRDDGRRIPKGKPTISPVGSSSSSDSGTGTNIDLDLDREQGEYR